MYYTSVWLHVLSAALWLGGMAFLVLVIVPTLKSGQVDSAKAADFIYATGMRFRSVGWACLGVLFLTGWFNMRYRGIGWGDLGHVPDPIAHALTLKLILFALVLAVSAVHDFVIGPRATTVWRTAPQSELAQKFRKQAGLAGRVNGLLALAIVYLAVLVARGGLP